MAPLSTVSPELAAENQRNLRRLVMSVGASFHKLNLLIAICNNPEYRDELIGCYEAELRAKGTECYQVRLDRQQPSLKQSLADLVEQQSINQVPALVTVLGGDELLSIRLDQPRSAQEQFFFSVQWTREGLREFHFPIVLWVSEAVAQGLAQQAPDFWSWRGGVFEFAQPRTGQATAANGQEPSRSYEPEALADPAELQQQIAALLAEDPDSPLLESLYQSLGITYYKRLEQGISQNQLQEQEAAIKAFQAAVKSGEALGSTKSIATSSNYLARLYDVQGRYAEAEPLYRRSLSIREQQLGENHPSVATSLNDLAAL
ncbi:MAG TPA: tetratricopeptide repeat protein [Thermosynechococcaceae cyanobacterium]